MLRKQMKSGIGCDSPPLEVDLSKIEMRDTGECTLSKGSSPRTTFGVRLSPGNVYPGYAKNAYPGLIFLHASGMASPKGCMEIRPGWSVLCDTRG